MKTGTLSRFQGYHPASLNGVATQAPSAFLGGGVPDGEAFQASPPVQVPFKDRTRSPTALIPHSPRETDSL